MSEIKYKVGDRVRIKSLDWYNANKDSFGLIFCNNICFDEKMIEFCGKTVTIAAQRNEKYYFIMEDNCLSFWTDEMIEGLVLEKGSELPSVVYIPYIIEDNPSLETSTEFCPKIEVTTRYNDKVKYEPKMVSLDKVKEWIKDNMYECDSGDEKWVNTYFHTFEEMFNDFNKTMEE